MTTDSPKPSASARSPGSSWVPVLEPILTGPLRSIGITATHGLEAQRFPIDETERLFATATQPSRQLLARLRSGQDVGLVEIFALEQQPRPRVFRHGVGKAVAEVELSGVSPSL